MTLATRLSPTPSPSPRQGRLIAIASGKGGVGKTWLAITLCHALARAGLKTLLFDGDLGLANVDIQLGLMPPVDLGDVIAGQVPLADAAQRYPIGGFDIIAGRSGSSRLANLAGACVDEIGDGLSRLADGYDFVILDLGAGIERTVGRLSRIGNLCIVVATDEPTALTDAYAFIKVTQRERSADAVPIVINMARSLRDGERTYGTLRKACEGFLKVSPPLLGVIRRDGKVSDAIRQQTPLLTRFPATEAAADVEAVAQTLIGRCAVR
jgi:flagellar biosynthesis protein FlhG